MRLHWKSTVWCGLWIAVAILLGAGAAGAQERLAMPYTCAVSGGRLFVDPSPERSYAIVGRRDQEQFDVCSPYNPSRCRVWDLHRFEVECDGGRVPWLSIVAAAPAMRGRQFWVENDRLHLRRGRERFAERRGPCFGLPWRGPGERFESSRGWGDCDSDRRDDRAVTVLPAGFAPLMQLGARIIAAPLPPARFDEPPRLMFQQTAPAQPRQELSAAERSSSSPRAGSEERAPLSATHNNAAPAKTGPPAQRSPEAAPADAKGGPRVMAEARSEAQKSPEVSRSVPVQNPIEVPKPREVQRPVEAQKPLPSAKSEIPKVDAWRTSTRIDDNASQNPSAPAVHYDNAAPDRGIIDTLIAGLHRHAPIIAPLLAALLILSLAFLAWRLLRPEPAGDAPEAELDREPVWPDLGGIGAPGPTRSAVEDLMRNADEFYTHVRQSAGQMPDANPLRDVIADELATIDATLRAPDLAAAYAAEDWDTLRRCAVQALTDLERIRRVVQGARETAAVAAPSAAAPQPERLGHPVPTTREEALALLGVNAEASEKVIKKIVDAMRQTWHPDLARDDADLRAREDRMKQINIAWDILRPKRQAA